jgi:hypothetical protein
MWEAFFLQRRDKENIKIRLKSSLQKNTSIRDFRRTGSYAVNTLSWNFYSASSLKQQSADIHIAPTRTHYMTCPLLSEGKLTLLKRRLVLREYCCCSSRKTHCIIAKIYFQLFQNNCTFISIKINWHIFSVLISSAVDRGFESRSGQIKDYKISICCFSAKHAYRPHSDALSWFRANKSLLFLLNCVLSGKATNTNFIVFDLTRSGLEPVSIG